MFWWIINEGGYSNNRPRAEKMVCPTPRSQYWRYRLNVWDGNLSGLVFEVSKRIWSTISWLIVHFSKMYSKNATFSTFLTIKMSKKRRFSSTFWKNAQLVMISYDHMSLKTSKARPESSHLRWFGDIFNIWFGGSENHFRPWGRLLE